MNSRAGDGLSKKREGGLELEGEKPKLGERKTGERLVSSWSSWEIGGVFGVEKKIWWKKNRGREKGCGREENERKEN